MNRSSPTEVLHRALLFIVRIAFDDPEFVFVPCISYAEPVATDFILFDSFEPVLSCQIHDFLSSGFCVWPATHTYIQHRQRWAYVKPFFPNLIDIKMAAPNPKTLLGFSFNARSEVEALNKKIADLSKGGGKLSTKGPTLSERLKEGVELQGDYRSALVSGVGRINMVVHKRDGSKITGTSTLSVEGKDLGETRWEGVVKGTRLTMTRVGSGNKVNTTLDLKGDSLEGSFVDSQGNRGTIGLRFPIP